MLESPSSAVPTFEYFEGTSNDAKVPIQIQMLGAISIQFDMGYVPIDNTGCFVKYSFPNDLPLRSAQYQYQGLDPMMGTSSQSAGISNYQVNSDVYIDR